MSTPRARRGARPLGVEHAARACGWSRSRVRRSRRPRPGRGPDAGLVRRTGRGRRGRAHRGAHGVLGTRLVLRTGQSRADGRPARRERCGRGPAFRARQCRIRLHGSQRRPVVDESTPEGRPNTAYSRVKLATERALLEADGGNTELVVLRPPFIWGRGMTTIDEMAEVAEAGRFAWIDHGRHIVDFVHVENLVGAVLLALTRGRHQGVYYVTDGTPMPIRDFLTPLLATRGVDLSKSRSVPLAVAAPIASMMDRAACLLHRKSAPPLTNWLVSFTGRDRSYDITAAREELGYSPDVTLEKGLAEMSS
ncbi:MULTISPECIES: NAD-dependent epimerase/dehydratase family protein [Saccharothrix]|uniref:NAD-dependent epimerase/dehydratase family protein n=1 Tax=Saccharothrix TaxID=2071 RepID=UPI0018EA0A6A|nr:NAD-dependent epimerase/dehydratase family protein [Saccharothrix sp. CB00851]